MAQRAAPDWEYNEATSDWQAARSDEGPREEFFSWGGCGTILLPGV
jgi:hypothetical protein